MPSAPPPPNGNTPPPPSLGPASSGDRSASVSPGGGSGKPALSPIEKLRILSTDEVELEAHLARPDDPSGIDRSAALILHGFPSGVVAAGKIGADLPELANRLAKQMSITALTIRFRGCGASTGDFSLQGWVDDTMAGIEYLRSEVQPDQVWIIGFGTGGALGIVAGAATELVQGVAAAGSPADFADWANNPNRLLAHAKRVGVITDSSFPHDLDDWKAQLKQVSAVKAVEHYAPRPLLILHGSLDDVVPKFDALVLADRHGSAQLRTIPAGSHLLRHDPRAIAILLGWLSRRRAGVDETALVPRSRFGFDDAI